MSSVFRREELFDAQLDLGGVPIALADYATTGLRMVAIGPSGTAKTNACLLVAEQLAAQGWVAVMVDPESDLAQLYGKAVRNPGELARTLAARDRPIVVVAARDAEEFIPYGRAILEAADTYRKPLLVCLDEAQLFSQARKRTNSTGEATDIVNEFAERGRKRCLDLCVTALRVSGSLNRAIFNAKNLTLIARQEDPTTWATLAPVFKASRIEYDQLTTLATGEFFMLSRRGIERIVMPMAKALAAVAPKAMPVKSALPTTFTQWDRAMRALPTPRLRALTPEVTAFLGAVAGLTVQQMLAGERALADELAMRA